jgi:hypothetical protein
MREQRPRFGREEEDANTDDSASEEDGETSLFAYRPYDRRRANEPNRKVSTFAPAREEREIGQAREKDNASDASGVDTSALLAPETYELNKERHGYSLRPRTQRNYKE